MPEPFGIGIYLLGSILGHSCVPSCQVKFLGRDLFITAKEEIAVDKLSTLATISYVNTMMDTKTRKNQLKENWLLTCNCTLCLDIKLVVQVVTDFPAIILGWTLLSTACPALHVLQTDQWTPCSGACQAPAVSVVQAGGRKTGSRWTGTNNCISWQV